MTAGRFEHVRIIEFRFERMCQPAPILDSDVMRFLIGFLPTAARRKRPTPVRAVSRYSALFANDHSSADTGGRGTCSKGAGAVCVTAQSRVTAASLHPFYASKF